MQNVISDSLNKLIDRDYYLLEVPYYTNIGDTLIWQGEMDFLKNFPYKCKGMYSLETFPYCQIPDNSLILFQGGGNFGDLWTKHHNFKMEIVRRYPNNKFVFFPQTVYFQSVENLKRCAKCLSMVENVTICARDYKSFQILKDNFMNEVLLVPDMAFFMKMDKWKKEQNKGERDLFLKRIDKEFKDSEFIVNLSQRKDMTVSDWPTMWPLDRKTKIMHRLRDSYRLPKTFADKYAYWVYRKHLIETGVELLTTHNVIYTTRLHTAILGVLLDKNVYFLDNIYGKNRTFYDTWLSDCDNVTFIA